MSDTVSSAVKGRRYGTLEVITDVSKRAGHLGAGWSIHGMIGGDGDILERGGCQLENNITTAEGEYAAALRGIYRANSYNAPSIVLLTDFKPMEEYVKDPSIEAAGRPPHSKYVSRIRRNLFEYDSWKIACVPQQNITPAHNQSRIACPTVNTEGES